MQTLWGAVGIVDLDEVTNRLAFVGAILGLTLVVLSFWAIYMRLTRKTLGQGNRDALRVDLGIA